MSALRETPRPWLAKGSGAPKGAKALLQAGLDVGPGPDKKDAVWAALALKIGPVGGGGAQGGAGQGGSPLHDGGAGTQALTSKAASVGSSAGKGLFLGAAKSAAVGALAAAALAFGYDALVPSEQASLAPPAQTAPAQVQVAAAGQEVKTASESAPIAVDATLQPGLEQPPSGGGSVANASANRAVPAVGSGPQPVEQQGSSQGATAPDTTGFDAPPQAPSDAEPAAAPVVDAVEARRSRLREEAGVIAEARGALRSGNPGQALVLLEAARIRFPDGVLGQEREALSIEALARGGQSSAASARARAFLAAYPNSAHAEHIQSFVGP